MPRLALTLAGSFCTFLAAIAQLNIAELRDAFYEVEIDSTPLGFDNRAIHADSKSETIMREINDNPTINDENYLTLANDRGQRFACAIPDANSDKAPMIAIDLTERLVDDKIWMPFADEKCIDKKIDYWTYILCYGDAVSQIHFEEDGAMDFEKTFLLGEFESNLPLPRYARRDTKAPTRLYFEQVYSGGDPCPETTRKRITTVRYHCDENLGVHEVAIASVMPSPPSSHCESVITVGVGSLCSLAAFKPTIPEEHATRRLRCQPVLDRGKKQVQAYVEKEIARKKKQARARRQHVQWLRRAASVQRQRNARKALTLLSDGEDENASRDEFLKRRYQIAMRLAAINQAIALDERETMMTISDNLADYSDLYSSERDEDRGNFFFYMRDNEWPKSDYPPVIRRVREMNAMSKMLHLREHDVVNYVRNSHFLLPVADGTDERWNWAKRVQQFERDLTALMAIDAQLDRDEILARVWLELIDSTDAIRERLRAMNRDVNEVDGERDAMFQAVRNAYDNARVASRSSSEKKSKAVERRVSDILISLRTHLRELETLLAENLAHDARNNIRLDHDEERERVWKLAKLRALSALDATQSTTIYTRDGLLSDRVRRVLLQVVGVVSSRNAAIIRQRQLRIGYRFSPFPVDDDEQNEDEGEWSLVVVDDDEEFRMTRYFW